MQDRTRNSTNSTKVQASSNARDWTQGSILKNLVSLSWPMAVNNSINTIGPLVDMIWVGKLGSDAVAAVGVAGTVVMLVNSLSIGLFTGLRSLVSRFIGARDTEGAVDAARQAIVFGIIYSIIIAAVGIFFSESILRILGVEENLVALGEPYLRIEMIGMMTMTFRIMTDGTMQASGDTRTPMKIAIAFRALHIILAPFLVFGLGFFPAAGIRGVAITGVVSQGLGTVLGLWILCRGHSRLRLTFKNFRFNTSTIWRLVKIGIPSSIMMLQSQLGQLVLVRLMVSFGTIAVAAHTICQRIDMTISFPIMGLAAGSGILVGQNLGARQPQRAAKSGWVAFAAAEIILVVVCLIVLIWPEIIIRVFSSDPELIQVASVFVRIAALGFIFGGGAQIFQQSLAVAGDTLPPMIISIIAIWGIQVPLALVFARIDSLMGVRWAIIGGFGLTMLASGIYFSIGRWKRQKV